MHIPKRYGESRMESCPFCGKQALSMNEQGFAVCANHKAELVPELKCACGEYLMMQKGKFGVFFTCMRCGNISQRKAFEINDIASLIRQSKAKIQPAQQGLLKPSIGSAPKTGKPYDKRESPKEEVVIRSDDPRYFDD